MRPNAKAEGTVTLTGQVIIVGAGASVTGTVTEGAAQPTIPAIPVIPPIQVVSITPVPGPATQVVSTTVPQISGTLLAGYLLKWENPAGYLIPSGGSATLLFQAKGTLAQGVYCNESWVDPGGASKTSTDLTAGIVAGSPASRARTGAAVVLTKSVTPDTMSVVAEQTYTYTITLQNTGTVNLNMYQLRDLLPVGFT